MIYFFNKISTIHRGNLESVSLYSFVTPSSRDMIKFNALYSFILQSGPKLKTFILSGDFKQSADGIINLDFSENQYIQHIYLDTDCTYSRRHKNCWEDIDGYTVQADRTQELLERMKHYVKLTWNSTKKNTELKLIGL